MLTKLSKVASVFKTLSSPMASMTSAIGREHTLSSSDADEEVMEDEVERAARALVAAVRKGKTL